MFWLTNTGVSASRIYWEHKASWAAVRNVSVPVAVSVFPDDVVYAPQSWTEQAYPNLVHYNEVDRGGHFAAWEQPELYASELRAASGRSARPTEASHLCIPSLGGRTEWLDTSRSAPPSCGPCRAAQAGHRQLPRPAHRRHPPRLGDIATALGAAQPEDKAALLTALGVSVSYDPVARTARVTCTLAREKSSEGDTTVSLILPPPSSTSLADVAATMADERKPHPRSAPS